MRENLLNVGWEAGGHSAHAEAGRGQPLRGQTPREELREGRPTAGLQVVGSKQ